jgi:hypothetical protein
MLLCSIGIAATPARWVTSGRLEVVSSALPRDIGEDIFATIALKN